mmetsp:Transcript_19345/g.47833  ORF Transcript_19345/g.47833 Transcript_19345/m.47833 type:complete len:112 (+) Transcript_19345:2-337(+)
MLQTWLLFDMYKWFAFQVSAFERPTSPSPRCRPYIRQNRSGNLIASNSPVAVLGTKQSLTYSRDHSVWEGLEHIARHNAFALMTDDISTVFMANATKKKAEFEELLPFSRL